MHYFDANATTPLHPAARQAWLETQDAHWYNPATPTAAGARASALLEECRARLAARINGEAPRVVFTSGATEANNAIFAYEAARTHDATAIVSATEHSSVLGPARLHFGARLRILDVDPAGVIRLEQLESLLATACAPFVSIMAANNETGVIQPLGHVSCLIARHANARLHTDATQWFGKMPPGQLPPCDYVTASAHKFGGPKGVGFLAFNLRKTPHFHGQIGGAQEHHHRAGTVNLPAIAAMLAALDATSDTLANATPAPRQAFETQLRNVLPGVVIHSAAAPERLWNTVSFAPPRHASLRWLKRLEKRAFTVATGAACASIDPDTPSHVLGAMGCSPALARRTLRVSTHAFAANWLALADALAQTMSELDASATAVQPSE
jgi:cysteine desulfurase